jgi:hypothetical protein
LQKENSINKRSGSDSILAVLLILKWGFLQHYVILEIMGRNSIKQYFIIALLLSMAIGVTIHFPMVMNYIFGESEVHHGERSIISFPHLGTELLITFLVALLMFTLNFFILKPVEKHRKIHLLTIILSVFLTLTLFLF